MKLFPTGIKISEAENLALLHVEADPEQWLTDILAEKVRVRREALINEWRPKLFLDPDVSSIPSDEQELAQLILARSDYRTRLQADAEHTPPEPLHLHNKGSYDATTRAGVTITLFPAGITISDLDCNCILAYVQDVGDWVLGALLGHINRGKKKLIREWQPKLAADPDVSSIPANEDALIQLVVARDDYRPIRP